MKLKKQSVFVISAVVIISIILSVMSPLFMIFGEELSYTPPEKMLYFKNSNNNGPLMQKITVEAEATYYLSFGIANCSSNFTVAAKDNSRSDISVNPTLISKTDKGRYDLYKYSVKIPADTTKAYIGLSFETGKSGYVFDFSLEKSGDNTHTNLYKNGSFNPYLDSWVWGTDANFVSTGTGKNKTEFANISETLQLKVLTFDETKFPKNKRPKADKDQMLYINAKTSDSLMTKVDLVPGDSYNLSFGLTNNAECSVVAFDKNGENLSIGQQLTKTDISGRYSTYSYTFTIPSTLNKDESSNTATVMIGFLFAENIEGYIFNVSLQKSDDDQHNEITLNGDFKYGLDYWGFGSETWFIEGKKGLGETKYDGTDAKLEVSDYDETKFTLKSIQDKMLYFNAKSSEVFITRLALVPGETYNFTFAMTNNVTDFSVLAKNDSRSTVAVGVEAKSPVVYDKYNVYTYSLTIPSNMTTDAGGGKALVFVGLAFLNRCEGYLISAQLENADDATHTNLITNNDFKAGLNNWSWGYNWFVNFPSQKGFGHFFFEDTSAKLQVMNYDESKFLLEAPKKQMLYFNGKNKDPFVSRLGLIPGEKYKISFSLTNNVVDFSVVATNDSRNELSINSKEESKDIKDKYTNYTYSFTVPSGMNADAGGGKALVFIGLSFPVGTEGYLFDLSIEKDGDTQHTELLANGKFKSGLDYWAWGYTWFIDFPGQKGKGFSKYDGTDAKLEVMDFDESKFTLKAPEKPKDKMLYFKNETSGPLSQRVVVEKGTKYYYSFYVSKNVVGAKISAKTNDSPARNSMSINANLLEKKDEGKHTYYKYEFTIPETFKTEPEKTTNFAFVGVSFITGYDGYFYNPKLVRADDETEKQILKNADFKSGLDYWDWDYSWFIDFPGQLGLGKTEYTTKSKDELKVMDFDESVFSTEIPDIPISNHRMLYFRNGANPSLFALRVASKPGSTYVLTYSTFCTDDVNISVATDGDRNGISTKAQLVGDPVEHGNYTTYTYKFTLPNTYSQEEKFIFVGVKIPYYAEGYIFDMSCYLADDKDKTELFTNPGFMKDLDGWIWGWDAWFGLGGNWQPSGMTKWTNGIGLIKVMDYDSTKFDELIADINKDDGVWWTKEDYDQNNANNNMDLGSAVLKGSFKDNKNNPIVNRKMILRSDEHSYNVYTDKSGNFAFNNIIPGIYELFSLDDNGNEVSTGFYELIEDGDILTVPLVTDISGLEVKTVAKNTKKDTGNSNEEIEYIYEEVVEDDDSNIVETDEKVEDEDPEVLVSFTGTVFTSKLKTVPNLKLYLRDFGEVTTDENGQFEFTDVPEGDYEIYTVLSNNKEYVFRTVSLKKNIKLAVKLKYDVSDNLKDTESKSGNSSLIILISAISAGVLLLGVGGTTFILIRKKKLLKIK